MSSISWTKRPGTTGAGADWLSGKKDREVRPAFGEKPVEPVDPPRETGKPHRESAAPRSYAPPSKPPTPAGAPMPEDRPLQQAVSQPPQPGPQAPPPPPEPPPELVAELERYLVALSGTLKQLEGVRRQMGRQVAEQAVEIGLAVAEQLAAGAIEVEPSRVLDIVIEAVDTMSGDGPVDVRVMPEIHRLLLENGFLEDFGEDSRINVRPDPSVGDQGCIVDGAHGRVDGRVKSRLLHLRHLIDQGEGAVEEEEGE